MGTYNAYRTPRQHRLPILLAILLFAFFVYFMTRRSGPTCTANLEHQHRILVYTKIIQDFVHRFEENGVTFFIFGSTLLGSYRHHGLIPYDDNIIHFAVNKSNVDTVRGFLIDSNSSSGSFNFTSYEVEDDAIFICPQSPIGPSIRISHFYHAGQRLRFSGANGTVATSSVFPLTVRPFESLMLPSPACPAPVLKLFYNLNLCCHTYVNRKPDNCVPCSIHGSTPFVERQRYTDMQIMEQLWVGDKALGAAKLLYENLCGIP